MTINYIVKGFDKDFYNFDAVVVPVKEMNNSKGGQEICGFRLQFLSDFRYDSAEIIQTLPISAFETDDVTAVRSEKTGIYYIFVLVYPHNHKPYSIMNRRTKEICRSKYYSYCCKEMVKYINKLDVKNILIHPSFNQDKFNINKDSGFLADTLRSNIDRFSQKNIYILVEELSAKDSETSAAFFNMRQGNITPEECVRIYVENQAQKSLSYTNSLIRVAEIETRYTEKSVMEQFFESLENTEKFFYEYINRYQGTAAELARKANISESTVSRIKKHEYKDKLRTVVISLAIALDLTVEDRKKFINSAGFSYPITRHDRFIEQQLRKKRYNDVREFNEDIWDEYPDFIIEVRSSGGYKNKKIR